MAKEDKKKQAMSLLFGDAPKRPRQDEGADEPAADEPLAEPVARVAPTRPSAAGQTTAPARPKPAPRVQPDRYYKGQGVYSRKDKDARKVSVYLDLDVWRALREAASTRDDPRGRDMGEIINTVLRQAGIGG